MKVIISILSGLLLAFSANAATVTVDANALGGYIQAFSGGSVVSGSGNYSVGEVSDFFGANVEVRNYAVFDLSAVGGTVTAATVRYFNPVNGFSSPYDPEAFGLSDVTTSIATLTSGAGGAAAFADLGSGIGLGGTFAGASTNGVFVNVPLNASGVAYVNSKLGGDAAFGGRLGALNDAFAEDRGFFWEVACHCPTSSWFWRSSPFQPPSGCSVGRSPCSVLRGDDGTLDLLLDLFTIPELWFNLPDPAVEEAL